MDINLNLPTLPTTNQKNALDGANSPSTSNVFSTANDLALKVPYTGANANVNLGEYEIKAGQLTLDITPTGTAAVGTTRWNDTIGSSEITLKGGNVVLKNGVDLVARVVNKVTPAATLTKANYTAVKVSGATGQRLSVDYAQADVDLNSADTIGLVTETIAANQEGFIITVGQLLEINTTGSLQGETWADGDVLYLSPSTAGRITNIKPTGATGHIVVMGYVEYAHAVHGSIYVKIGNGWELDELHNVYINPGTLADKNLLAYESSTSLWKNKSASTLGIAELASPTFTGTVVLPSTTSIGTVSSTEIGYLDNVTSAIQTQLNAKSTIASPTFTGTVTSPAIILSSETASTIASFDASKNIKSLPLATYPSLTELSYVKGVTQSIQPLLTDARDLKYAAYDNTDKTITGTTAETYLAGLLVPTLTANSSLDFLAIPNKTGTAGTIVWSLYYNSTNDMAGSPVKIATFTHTAVQLYGGQFIRRIVYKNSLTSAMIFRATVASANDFSGNATAMTSLAIDLSAKYLVITATLTNAADTAILSSFQLMHTKP